MKNAFHVNLPKANPKLKSAVSALASPPGTVSREFAGAPSRPTVPYRRAPAPVLKLSHARGVGEPVNEAHREWFSMLNELEGHVHRALEARGRLRPDVDDARSVLARTTEAAVEALHSLATVEKQLQDRSQVLNSILEEIEQLKGTRSNALALARRLARVDHRTYA